MEINQKSIRNEFEDLGWAKRWFRDAVQNCDIFTWQKSSLQLVRFQLWMDDFLMEWDAEKGIKTGKIDKETGAFKNLQAQVFKYHRVIDQDIINDVSRLISTSRFQSSNPYVLQKVISQIQNIK